MNKTKLGFKNLHLPILFILLIGASGFTLTSCSASSDEGNPPPATYSSAIYVGESSSSIGGESSSSSGGNIDNGGACYACSYSTAFKVRYCICITGQSTNAEVCNKQGYEYRTSCPYNYEFDCGIVRGNHYYLYDTENLNINADPGPVNLCPLL